MKSTFFSAILLLYVLVLLNSCSPGSSGFDQVAEYKKDTTSIESYLAANNIRATKYISDGTVVGWYVIDSAASGFRPNFADTISLTHSVELIPSGTVAASSTTPVVIPLEQLLPVGVQVIIQEFQKGSKGRIFIPSYYGYGSTANGTIPANSTLMVQFHLVDVMDHQLIHDTTAIGSYLRSESITNYTTDPSGIRYVITNEGTGVTPSLTDSIKVTYTTASIPSGTVIDKSTTTVEFLLNDLVESWKIGLPLIKVGGSIAMYTPSGMAYGPTPTASATTLIPANSNLIFTVQLIGVVHN